MVSEEEIISTFPVMRQLRTHLKEDEYLKTVERMRRSGYRLAAVVDEGRVRCVAGFRIQEYLYCGRHLYVDDLITDGSTRSRGHGKRMLDWLTEESRGAGCVQLHLDSGVQRSDTHRFYFREGLTISAYHFRKDLR
jgi:GNAT superfamily N-acetyltransferase